jgi:hypothetical protein
MTTNARYRQKGRKVVGTFALLPHAVMDSSAWRLCGGTAIKLLCDMARQYNSRNNGDLCAAESIIPGYAPETRSRALRELRHYGFILLTRQGGLHGPSLFALTWHAIDECGGKLQVAATRTAPGHWKGDKARFKARRKKSPLRIPKMTATDSEDDPP